MPTATNIRTASQLKAFVEAFGNCPHFFDRKTMRFSGDTMRNYGVRGPIEIVTNCDDMVKVYELYRRHPVKYGLTSSAYFDAVTFRRVFIKKD